MCTAVCCRNEDSYFGRNLDLERGYGEQVVITPRNYEFKMRCLPPMRSHYAMIGMAAVVRDIPLYFEATNEKGLSMAGLNFPGNAVYCDLHRDKDNVAPFEFIPWILGQCSTVGEVKHMLDRINLANMNFSEDLPLSPLHWMISDKKSTLTVESVHDGLKIYDNPFEVLTNNPTFDFHFTNMSNYMALDVGPAVSRLKPGLPVKNYSLGMGALGLPGDFSSPSRFVKAFFVKENSLFDEDEKSKVNQFFHILGSVAMPKGCVLGEGGFEYTRYTSCCNVHKGIYYYTTYGNSEITAVDMRVTDLNGSRLYIHKATGM